MACVFNKNTLPPRNQRSSHLHHNSKCTFYKTTYFLKKMSSKYLRKHLPIAEKLAENRRKWRETTGWKCARSSGYRHRMEAWNYWQARRRPAMMAGRRVCSGEVRRRRGVDGWLAGHLVHWFARESTGGRKKNVGKKEEKPFF